MNLAIISFVMANLLVTRLPILPEVAPFWFILPIAIYGLSQRYSRLISAGSLGLLFALAHGAQRISAWPPVDVTNEKLNVIGQVVSLPSVNQGIAQFRFRIDSIEHATESWQGLAAISWYRAPVEVSPGAYYRLTIKLSRPGGSLNPGLFDYEGWSFAQGILARGYLSADQGLVLREGPPGIAHIHRLRSWLRNRMEQRLKDSSVKGLLIALTIGETRQISSEEWSTLTKTGTNHLLIISGLHVGLVAAMIYRLLILLSVNVRLSSLVTLILVIGYGALAGFGLPVQRALMMTSVLFLAIYLDRKLPIRLLFCISLLGVILLQPFAALSAGFWLSFGAVFSLIYAFTGRQVPGIKEHRYLKLFIAAIRTQWVVTLAMFPLLLHLVFQVSLIAFVVNIFAIPLVSLAVIPFLLLFVFFMPFLPTVSDLCLLMAEQSLSVIWIGISRFAEFDWVFHGAAPGSVFLFMISLVGALMFIMPRGLSPRWVGIFAILPVFNKQLLESDADIRVTFIDVGQGLSVLIQTENSNWLYDAGPRFGSRFDSGERIVSPLLHRLGVDRLNAMIISHGDNDHAGGMNAMIKNFPIDNIVAPTFEKYRRCDVPVTWEIDDIKFTLFSASGGTLQGNDTSCLLLVTSDQWGILLTGDIEARAEGNLQKILGKRIQGDAHKEALDVISVPHHGSRTSSTIGFVNLVQVNTAVISSAFQNRFSHPDPEVVKRYRRRNVRVLNTANEGAISIWLGEGGIRKIALTRELERRFWHR